MIDDANACGSCCAPLIQLCPHCDLGSSTRHERDTIAPFVVPEEEESEERVTRRPPSEPPPIPGSREANATALVNGSYDQKLAARLIALNVEKLGPSEALDLTNLVVEDSEDLAQDEIDALFNQ